MTGRSRNSRRGRRVRGELSWEFVFVIFDDATRLPYAVVLPNERAEIAGPQDPEPTERSPGKWFKPPAVINASPNGFGQPLLLSWC